MKHSFSLRVIWCFLTIVFMKYFECHAGIREEGRVTGYVSVLSDTVYEKLGFWPRRWEDFKKAGIDLSVFDDHLGLSYKTDYIFVHHQNEVNEIGIQGRIIMMRKSAIAEGDTKLWPLVFVLDENAVTAVPSEKRMIDIISKYNIQRNDGKIISIMDVSPTVDENSSSPQSLHPPDELPPPVQTKQPTTPTHLEGSIRDEPALDNIHVPDLPVEKLPKPIAEEILESEKDWSFLGLIGGAVTLLFIIVGWHVKMRGSRKN